MWTNPLQRRKGNSHLRLWLIIGSILQVVAMFSHMSIWAAARLPIAHLFNSSRFQASLRQSGIEAKTPRRVFIAIRFAAMRPAGIPKNKNEAAALQGEREISSSFGGPCDTAVANHTTPQSKQVINSIVVRAIYSSLKGSIMRHRASEKKKNCANLLQMEKECIQARFTEQTILPEFLLPHRRRSQLHVQHGTDLVLVRP